METTTAIKSGRAFNGAHRDAGTIVHLVPKLPAAAAKGYWGGKSLCGTAPGLRGNGWHEVKTDATCEKCIKKRDKYIVLKP